ncbi:DNA polymerase LigD, polymerase domain protein [Xylanimonas cellulosilytica DSM 15894]|uniref:DNA ligase (ATP) n=1 Tax=Xylanimonas cellulosilytica (strain DSM 15894 / JCM 12276 / CECT 5975 / KCTC 9989 / LMG 20990 / NBRC 107835 / XIL07) TaxID=446471 RepID=D1BV12_XYLCX|nr:ATP-dependent DNA ligase [Xylanimonas cellulosilytica]ACZ31251.1 DNA polymerase LigD, polymerase domain protein [Xylanimonas cellulosilytica DSM 15894]
MGAPTTVTVDGHRLQLTNLDKVLYPATGTTKGEVIDYLARIAPVLLPHARRRPATRKRWPDGVEGQVFFQKNADRSTPSWVRTHRIQHKTSANDYVLVDDVATLTWLGQTASLELHVPQWQVGRTGTHLPPDRLVLDLDPGEGAGLPECAEVARLARAILQGMGLEPLPVTSGSKGIHLYAALSAGSSPEGAKPSSAEQITDVAHELARYLEAEHPDLVVSDMKKSLRGGKVLVDWSQNNGAKTTIAPYSLRGRTRPTVAAPRTWAELDDPDLRQLSYEEVLDRVARDGDLLAGLTAGHLSQLEPTPAHLARFERLATYNAKRDPARTPEPFDTAPPAPVVEPVETTPPVGGVSTGSTTGVGSTIGVGSTTGVGAPTFVIQEHHARRLHWDFRLERDGVLVSWALPKGEPTDPGTNHLAVQTEDHPLAYGGFEGTIPNGEYGAGEVTIWDSGTYETEKWRDGKEVIAVLHSERRGTRRLALIRTGRAEGDNQWLIHRTKAQPAEDVASPAPVVEPVETTTPTRSTAEVAVRLEPMLASAAQPAEVRALEADGESGSHDWVFEMKWDGYRTLAVVEPGPDGTRAIRLTSRTGQDFTRTYPELAPLAAQVTGELPVVLDAEIVALDAAGRPDFRRLQQHAGNVELMVFDVLQVGDRSLLHTPYDERRTVLADVLDARRPVHLPAAFDGDLTAALETSRRLRLEGVMAKRRESTYQPGRRTRQWLKLKHTAVQEVVVVGWRPLRAGETDEDPRYAGGLLLAVPADDGALRYVGRVGTGFSDAERRDVATRLAAVERKTPPLDGVPRPDAAHTRWVTPRLVGEVEFAEWTGDPTDDPEARLRAARWRGWRPDKEPADVVVEP